MNAHRALLGLCLLSACSRSEPAPRKPSPVTPTVASAPAPSSTAAPATSCANAVALPALQLGELKSGPASVPLSSSGGLWLADENGALLSAIPEVTWTEGSVQPGAGNTATRAVKISRLPKALRAWLGRRVVVLGANGAVCETHLQRFVVRAEITPDARTAEHWEGCADGPPISAETIANEVWQLSAKAGRSLIGEFSTPCKGALLAVDPDLPAPAIAAPRPASSEEGDAAMTALRALPEYAQIQARFRKEQPGAEGHWDDHEARHTVSVLALPGEQRAPITFISVEVGDGCRGFSASLSAIGNTALRAIDDRRLSVSAIADLDGNESAILLGPDGPFKARSVVRNGQRSFLNSVPFFPGPC